MKGSKKRENQEARKGFLFMLTGIALVLKLVLQMFDIEISDELINDTVTAILGLAATFGVYRNNYFGEIGRAQYQLFKDPAVRDALERALQQKESEDL